MFNNDRVAAIGNGNRGGLSPQEAAICAVLVPPTFPGTALSNCGFLCLAAHGLLLTIRATRDGLSGRRAPLSLLHGSQNPEITGDPREASAKLCLADFILGLVRLVHFNFQSIQLCLQRLL